MSIERLVRKQLHGPARRSATRMSVKASDDSISLAAGDPSFLLPKYIADTVNQAILDGYTHYMFGGDPELKVEVAKYYSKYGYKVEPSQVALTNGGSGSIFQAYATILNEGDEVVAFDPAYSGGTMTPAYFGAKTVYANLMKDETGFYDFDEEALKNAITAKTKALYVENPGNPSGKVYGEKECKVMADLCNDNDLIFVSDETYTEYIWTGRDHFPIITLPGMENRTLIAMALTKMFSWAGMRTGWIISGPELAPYVGRAPDSGLSWPIQKGAIKALRDGYQFVLDMRKEYEERIDYGVKRLNEMPGLKCPKPEGAFYLFPCIEDTGMKSAEFCQKLNEEEHVRLIPGAGYGKANGEGNVRLSMIRPLRTQTMSSWFEHQPGLMLEDAMDRIENFVKRHV